MAAGQKESPLRRKPLRLPGQSLQEEIDRIIDEKLFTYLMFGEMLGFVVLMEWAQVWFKLPPQPCGASWCHHDKSLTRCRLGKNQACLWALRSIFGG